MDTLQMLIGIVGVATIFFVAFIMANREDK
jgi:hypothetical protein